MPNQPPLNPDGVDALAFHLFESEGGERKNWYDPNRKINKRYYREIAGEAARAYLAAAQPEVTRVEELDKLPLGVTVLGADMIAYQMLGDASFPDGRFRETSWWASGNEYEVTSIPLPARVLYRQEVKP